MTKSWEWRESTQRIADWIALNVDYVESAWDNTATTTPLQ